MGHGHGKHAKKHKHKGKGGDEAAAAAAGAGAAGGDGQKHTAHGYAVKSSVTGHYSNLRDIYTVEGSELGHGHYGQVFTGLHKETGRRDAIKVIPKKKVKNLDSLKNEIKIMQELSGHQYIITLYDVFEDHRNLYLAMELCEGGELFYQIQQAGSYHEGDAAVIMSQLLKALVHCHEHHICHRDLKPENFLLKAKGDITQLKVIDFGLSRIFEEGQHMHSRAGTPYYIAPEVLKRDYGPECDMWSAGVMLYILLCGYPPFWGDNDEEIYESVRCGEFDYDDPAWDKVSAGAGSARDLIESLLTLDTEARLTAKQALDHPWIHLHVHAEEKPDYTSMPTIDPKVFDRIVRFTNHDRLKKVAKRAIAEHLSDAHLKDLFNQFKATDSDGVGYLSIKELSAVLDATGHHMALGKVSAIMEGLDVDHDGRIKYEEFVAAVAETAAFYQEDKLHNAFERLDPEHKGEISRETIEKLLADDGHAQHTVDEMMARLHVSDEGHITFPEFTRLMKAYTGDVRTGGGGGEEGGEGVRE